MAAHQRGNEELHLAQARHSSDSSSLLSGRLTGTFGIQSFAVLERVRIHAKLSASESSWRFKVKVIYKISYPTGKIYIGKDRLTLRTMIGVKAI